MIHYNRTFPINNLCPSGPWSRYAIQQTMGSAQRYVWICNKEKYAAFLSTLPVLSEVEVPVLSEVEVLVLSGVEVLVLICVHLGLYRSVV